jgi:hypothetical protein
LEDDISCPVGRDIKYLTIVARELFLNRKQYVIAKENIPAPSAQQFETETDYLKEKWT